MYELFLCLRYLRRRYLAWIAVFAVALCVAMMLIVVSVMDGFVGNVERAAKGIFGDIVIDASGVSGLAGYDEFIAKLKREMPDEIAAATPVINTYGLLRIGDRYTETVQIWGIRLPQRAEATGFGQGLFVQAGWPAPTFDPPMQDVIAALEDHGKLIEQATDRERAKPANRQDERTMNRLLNAWGNIRHDLGILERSGELKQKVGALQKQLQAEQEKPEDQRDNDLIERLSARIQLMMDEYVRDPQYRVILGLGIGGLCFRTDEGATVRAVGPGQNVVLTLLPVGRGSLGATITPNTRTFTVIDDCKTDVYTIDSKTVYVPFDTLQGLCDMAERKSEDGEVTSPAACSQIQVKVKPAFSSDPELVRVRQRIEALWAQDHAQQEVSVQTWREKLEKFIGSIQKQRTLMLIINGIMSFVSIMLIFSIFYMIVVEKTRDIGVIRAVGGSSGGVARIFLAFGAVTGVAGSVLGTVGGCLFVHYINNIQDLLAAWFGFRVWDRDVFLFDKIPNQVDPSTVIVIVVWAVASGLVGALIPAMRAAVMEPVEAIRYE